MQSSNTPDKLTLPFASAGAKNTIPAASQIGITAGAASLTDGFPPLTRTPKAAGGKPPSGLDMNGILYELSAVIRWANAGGGYAYDSVFATDSNVGGYPKGARVMRSDGLGYWLNTAENNQVDPETSGAVAAGWVPDFTTGAALVTMTSANVTLTPLQYGKPIIIISGALTSNLNLIFPNIAAEWLIINNTTGDYTVTCKTAAGSGIVVNTTGIIVGDATNIYAGNKDAAALLGANVVNAGGTADALTVTLPYTVRGWDQIAGVPFWVRAASANATTTPTVAVNGLTAKTIVKGANTPLVPGDIAGAGHWIELQYDATLDKLVLLNPATGVSSFPDASTTIKGKVQLATSGEAQALTDALKAITPATLASAFQGGNQSLATPGYQKLPGGLIIQWLRGTAGQNSSSANNIFPIAFPTSLLFACGIHSGADASVNIIADASNFSSTQVGMRSNLVSSSVICLIIAIGY